MPACTPLLDSVNLPDPEDVRNTRLSEQRTMDVWDASACGLTDTGSLCRLEKLRMGTEARQDGEPMSLEGCRTCQVSTGNATTYTLGKLSYVPYESSQLKRYQRGDEACREAIDAVYCHDVRSSVGASPLAGFALLTALSERKSLWHEAGKRIESGLAQVAAIAPRKGGGLLQLIKEYRHAERDSAASMILRDVYSSIYFWQFIRSTDMRTLDLCGSVLCLTIAIDWAGASDDPTNEGTDTYIASASEGLAYLAGNAATHALKDIVTTSAFMVTKELMVEKSREVSDIDAFLRHSGGPVSPDEFLCARWWDAAMVPYHRLVMSTGPYKHLTDELGTFRATDACENIRRTFDSIIRYDEIVDIVSDYANKECFNEFLVALAIGGSSALHGYADAIARVIDNVLTCKCDAVGHQQAAELAMGTCLWYLICPRYIARKQLLQYAKASNAIREAYSWADPGLRLRAVHHISLESGEYLHTRAWQPLWSLADIASCGTLDEDPAHNLAQRAVRRCLVDGAGTGIPQQLEDAAFSALRGCNELDSQENLRNLSERWISLFAAVTAFALPSRPTGLPETNVFNDIIERIWRDVIIDSNYDTTQSADALDERLFIDTDRAIRQTYSLPFEEGIPLRRAFFGVISCAIELSGLGPYSRLNKGAVRMHDRHTAPLGDKEKL